MNEYRRHSLGSIVRIADRDEIIDDIVDLDAGVEGARGLLEISLAVLILAVTHDLADVVDEGEGPGVLGVDLVLARELDAVGVEVEHGVRGEHRALVRRGGGVAGDGGAPGEGGGASGRLLGVHLVERVGERPAEGRREEVRGERCSDAFRGGGDARGRRGTRRGTFSHRFWVSDA